MASYPEPGEQHVRQAMQGRSINAIRAEINERAVPADEYNRRDEVLAYLQSQREQADLAVQKTEAYLQEGRDEVQLRENRLEYVIDEYNKINAAYHAFIGADRPELIVSPTVSAMIKQETSGYEH